VRLRFKLLGWNVLFMAINPKNKCWYFAKAGDSNEIGSLYQRFIALFEVKLPALLKNLSYK